MAATVPDAPGGAALKQRRQRGASRLGFGKKLLLRPEFTAVVGTIIIFAYFAIDAGSDGFLSAAGTRNYLEVAAEVGIVATPITLLLVAGEFDLSVGAMIGAAGIVVSYPIVEYGWPLWAALLLGLAVACAVGAINGFFVVRTGIPSFLVTLASMFVISGATLAITNSLTGTTNVAGIKAALGDDFLLPLFDGELFGVAAAIWWWLGLTIIAALVLDKTRFGNWIYASGGNADAAFKAGVPVRRVKMMLFMSTAVAATLVATLATLAIDSADLGRGDGKEFQAATAAVIGGALITGGLGSPLGTAVGALLFGMVSQGFFFTSIDDSWFQTFLGAMLLLAVIVNQYTRTVGLRTRSRG